MTNRMFAIAMVLLALATSPSRAQNNAPVLRFPDVHRDVAVFTYAGDLWRVPTTGGTAVRLTAHPGLELFAKISPDGQWIAFTGQYDGDEQVYVMPISGGEPRKLTHYPARGPLPPRWGYDNQVYGWTPDGKAVLFRSLMDGFDLTDSRLYTVPMTGGLPTALPMPVSGAGTLSPDGKTVLYSPLFRDFRTWKRYQGGWAQDLWLFDIASKRARNVTNTVRTERDPMWLPSGPYFVSDRSGILNIYKLDPQSAAATAVTRYTEGDVRWASDGPGGSGDAGQMIFERQGELTLLDSGTGVARVIPVTVPDDGLYTRPYDVDASDTLGSGDIGPKGARAVVVGRGDIFVVPTETGVTRNLTASSNAHDREASISPDGKTIAFISDASGEEEIWLIAENGRSPARQLTRSNKTRFGTPRWSPDGRQLLVAAKTGALIIIDVNSGTQREIDRNGRGMIGDAQWSTDSQWVAYSKVNPNGYSSLMIWSRSSGEVRRITDPMFDATEPVFARDGKYLFFLSRREFAPVISQVETNFALDQQTGIFALALTKSAGHLFPPVEDDRGEPEEEAVVISASKSKDEKKPQSPPKPSAKSVQIDFDGLAQRSFRLPISPGNYNNLNAVEGGVLYQVGGTFYLGREPRGVRLERFTFKDKDTDTIADGIDGYSLSIDASTILVRTKATRFRSAAWSAVWIHARNGPLCLMKCGGATAIIFMWPICMAMIGRRLVRATGHCCPGWRIDPT
jgi:tricorn protease